MPGIGGHLGHELVAVAGNAFERFAKHLLRVAVGFGGLEETDAVVVGVADEARESFLTEFLLSLAALGTGAESEAGDFHSGFAESDPIRCGAGSAKTGKCADAGNCAGGRGGFEKGSSGDVRHEYLRDWARAPIGRMVSQVGLRRC